MSGIILDQDGHQIAGEVRQQVAVQAEQGMVASSLGVATGQLLMALTKLALNPEIPIERVEHIEKMFERARAYEARSAYTKAMAKAKAEMPPILKTKHVGFKARKAGASDTSYNHEDLSDVTRVTDPILGKYGLTSTFRVSNADKITVTCVIRHEDGHEDDSNTLTALKDDSGNKNNNQQVASTITYLKRYTLMAALGLAAIDEDDDGRASEVQETPITPEQVAVMRKALVDTGANEDKFCQVMMVDSVETMPSHRYEACMGEIRRTYQLRQKVAADEAARVADAARLADAEQLKTTAEHAARTTTPSGQGRMI